jgi:two-component system nitrate/nitrite response regulator NarL
MADGAGMRVLLCDDDPLARDVAASVLHDAGFALVGQAANGPECIQLAEMLRPDVVIVDHALIGMSGLETVPVVRRLLPDAVIVLLTAFDGAVADAPDAGADAGLDKTEVGGLARLVDQLLTARAGGDASALR